MVSDVHTPYRRILLTRMKFIGDIVLTTSLLRDLRAACPDAFIAFLGEKNAVALLEGNPSLMRSSRLTFHGDRSLNNCVSLSFFGGGSSILWSISSAIRAARS